VVCKLWIGYTALHSVTLLAYISYQMVDGLSNSDIEETPEELIITFAYLLIYKAYAIYVALKFIAEIKQFGGLNGTLIHLSDKEVEEFLYGTLGSAQEAKRGQTGNEVERRGSLPPPPAPLRTAYDKTYEISLDQLEIGRDILPIRIAEAVEQVANETVFLSDPVLLGRGKYGTIHPGHLRVPTETAPNSNDSKTGENGTSTVIQYEKKRVAVKTLENAEVDSIYFRALLSELKIMIYLGEHPNIVRLIGVCTAQIRKSKAKRSDLVLLPYLT